MSTKIRHIFIIGLTAIICALINFIPLGFEIFKVHINPLSAIPLLIACINNPIHATFAATLSGIIIMFFDPLAAITFLLSDTPLALAVGMGIHYKKSRVFTSVYGSFSLAIGLITLDYYSTLSVFNFRILEVKWDTAFVFIYIFSLAYSFLLTYIFDYLVPLYRKSFRKSKK